jgi:hypothetical protein
VALPDLNDDGELPLGIHASRFAEVLDRFGGGTAQRQAVTARLTRIYQVATATGKLARVVVFGSYVTSKEQPKDVDLILVMEDDFDPAGCDEETQALFDHRLAGERFGASVFWLCRGSLILETMDEFLAHWQIKRDRTQRGIVEIIA